MKRPRLDKPKRLAYEVTMMKHGPASSLVFRVALIVAVLAFVVMIVRLRGHSFHVGHLRHLIEDQGAYGPAIFFVIYFLAVVLALPESPFTALAGTLFHPGFAIAEVSVISTIGAGLSFLAARYWARDYITKKLEGNNQMESLNRLTDTHGWLVCLLIRVVPLFPSALLNYGFGLTRVNFWVFVVCTWVGMLPGIALYVMGTDVIARAYTHHHIPWTNALPLLAVLGALAYLSHRAWQYVNPKSPAPECSAS